MATSASSILVHALEQAEVLALRDGADRGLFPTPPTAPAPNPDGTISYIEDVGTQLAQVQRWLRANPGLLRILDAGIRDEVRRMEQRTNRVNILTNLGFTVLGTILGLLAPTVLAHFLTH